MGAYFPTGTAQGNIFILCMHAPTFRCAISRKGSAQLEAAESEAEGQQKCHTRVMG